MGTKRRRWRRVLFLSPLILGALCILVLHLVSDFGLSEREVHERFAQAGIPFTLQTRNGVSFVETGNPEGRVVVFIHGSPGSWDNFIGYLLDESLRKSCRLISVNRLGYVGDSRGRPEHSLKRQAEAVMRVLPEGTPVLAVGHSMGGPIAVRLAADYPDRVAGLLLLSAAVDPDLERVLPIQRVGNHPLIAWMLPASLNVCNRELMPLQAELEILEETWPRLRIPLLAVHGEEDGLVPVANMDYLRLQVPEDRLEIRILKGENHFIPWTREAEVIQSLRDLLEASKSAGG